MRPFSPKISRKEMNHFPNTASQIDPQIRGYLQSEYRHQGLPENPRS
jgi:hypothetical protein